MMQQKQMNGQTNGTGMHSDAGSNNITIEDNELEIQSYKSDTNVKGGNKTNGARSSFTTSCSDSSADDQIKIRFEDWGFKIDRLFEVAYRFYKRNESKAFHPSFDERNKMIALIMQARYGNHDGGRAPDIGALDLVGKRRQHEWSLLNGMSKAEAMSKFIYTLDEICPIFKAHAEAIRLSSDFDHEQKPNINKSKIDERGESSSRPKPFDTEMHNIYSSLCKQTYCQFKGYAEKQYPDDLVQQKHLISSLQEQYYQQYISQMHPESKSNLTSSNPTSNGPSSVSSATLSTDNDSITTSNSNQDSFQKTLQSPSVTERTSAIMSSASANYVDGGIQDKKEQTDDSKSLFTIPLDDSKCDDNNFQADISCEELNSEVVDESKTISLPQSPINQMVNELQTVTISNNPKSDISQPQNVVEPVKLYQNIESPPIGMFESFPEPKPITRLGSQKSMPIDMINPNLPVAQAKASELSIQEQQQDQTTTRSPVQEVMPQSYENTQVGQEQCDEPPPVSPSSALNMPLDSSDNYVNHNYQQHNYLLDEFHSYPGPRAAVSDINVEPNAQVVSDAHGEISASPTTDTNQRVPELWGYASSGDIHAGSNQALQPMVECEELEPATIWSKRGVAEFKESLSDDRQGGVYEVKGSTLVVIQVPTYPDGKYIYWEFATDDYDIGFGVDFVYEQALVEPLALHIYEDSDDEDLDEDPLVDGGWSASSISQTGCNRPHDPETGPISTATPSDVVVSERDRGIMEKRKRLANTISIVPTYRRDSHEEVFFGRHKYPDRGYYLLKFDNTYSVLRAKTLYFRICYFI